MVAGQTEANYNWNLDYKLGQENNIIININYLSKFIQNNLVCKECYLPLNSSFAIKALANVIACSCAKKSESYQTVLILEKKKLGKNLINDPTDEDINFIKNCKTLNFSINDIYSYCLFFIWDKDTST